MDNGISTNGSTNGNKGGLTGTSPSSDSSPAPNSSNPNSSNTGSSDSAAKSTSSETFTFPLPRRKPGSHIESAQSESAQSEYGQTDYGQHSTPDEDTSTSTDNPYSTRSSYETEAPYSPKPFDPAQDFRPASSSHRETEASSHRETEYSSHREPEAYAPTATASSVPETDYDALGRTVMRRKAMGESAVRVAGRLAHAELLQEYRNSPTSAAADPMSDADHLLALLGDYLAAAGFERPELHAKLSGQSIIVDLTATEQ